MKPLTISHCSIVNSLGAGSEAVTRALRERRSGLTACDFETVELDTYIGQVSRLDQVRIPTDLGAYDLGASDLGEGAEPSGRGA